MLRIPHSGHKWGKERKRVKKKKKLNVHLLAKYAYPCIPYVYVYLYIPHTSLCIRIYGTTGNVYALCPRKNCISN